MWLRKDSKENSDRKNHLPETFGKEYNNQVQEEDKPRKNWIIIPWHLL
ncbi:hypothetical protein L195_g040354, partial [Trifolium pratense]